VVGLEVRLRAYLGLRLKNKVFKSKRVFRQKLYFFCQNVFLAIFRLLGHLKALLIFLTNEYIFLQTGFFSVKSTLSLSNPKQALRVLVFQSKPT
jgi:hypothetical protein